MADFLDVGGVRIPTRKGTWSEERVEIGDIAKDGGGLAMSGRPIESRAAVVRIWRGTTPWTLGNLDGVTAANAPAHFERINRWVEGWGQCFPCGEASGVPIAGSGLTLGPAANITMGSGMTVASGVSAFLNHTYAMRIRRGFSPTTKNGWSMVFKRTFQAAEAIAAGVHWCVATSGGFGSNGVVYNQASAANPAGVTQYVDGAATNFNVGNITQVDATNFLLYGKKTDATNAAVVFSDVAFLPFALPASWVSQIWTNIINPGTKFPVLPRQRLSGQWLTNEAAPVEVIGRVNNVHQKHGRDAVGAGEPDARELDIQFAEW